MFIKRIRVEEGFFDQLDLCFTKGLNVLVGGRGVGKTSVIELIRYALDVGGVSEASTSESKAHALSVLQSSGRVVIDFDINGADVSVSRSASENFFRATHTFTPPLIFSQKEIEAIGLNAVGKVKLVDSFIFGKGELKQELKLLYSEIRSLCASLVSTNQELEEAKDNTLNLDILLGREKELVEIQKSYEIKNSSIKNTQEKLDSIQGQLGAVSVDERNLISLQNYFISRRKKLEDLVDSPPSINLISGKALEIYNKSITKFDVDNKAILSIIESNDILHNEILSAIQFLQNTKLNLDEGARSFRGEVEKFTEGAGAVLSELGRVRESLAQIRNWQSVCIEKQNKIQSIYDRCQKKILQVSNIKASIFEERKRVIDELNIKLHPTIHSEVHHLKRQSYYIEALRQTLKGSGLKYNEAVDLIASNVSPAFLLYYAYTLKYEDFAAAVGLPIDRATRLLGYLHDCDLGDVVCADIQDEVNFALLDGGAYKQIDDLSIGQRCTVALSVILENKSRVLIIDQPEDHLDNEFIAKTLIKALVERAADAQTIVSSHNANIPVLGKAELVVNLDSNGRRGFVKNIGSIDHPNIRSVIEKIMEGGKEAFNQRATFYSESDNER